MDSRSCCLFRPRFQRMSSVNRSRGILTVRTEVMHAHLDKLMRFMKIEVSSELGWTNERSERIRPY